MKWAPKKDGFEVSCSLARGLTYALVGHHFGAELPWNVGVLEGRNMTLDSGSRQVIRVPKKFEIGRDTAKVYTPVISIIAILRHG